MTKLSFGAKRAIYENLGLGDKNFRDYSWNRDCRTQREYQEKVLKDVFTSEDLLIRQIEYFKNDNKMIWDFRYSIFKFEYEVNCEVIAFMEDMLENIQISNKYFQY